MWHKVQIKYEAEGKKKTKKVKELYLIDGIFPADIQYRMTDLMKDRITDMTFPIVNAVSYSDVLCYPSGSKFYEITYEWGATKPMTLKMLLNAVNDTEASNRAKEYLGTQGIHFEITDLKKSKYLAVWKDVEVWAEDFARRMVDLADLGKVSHDINQVKIDFEEKGSDDSGDYTVDPALVEKYNVALDELGGMLSQLQFTPFVTSQFIKKHGITSTFFALLVEMGALEKAPKVKPTDTSEFRKAGGYHDLTGYEVLKHMAAKRSEPVVA